MNFNLTKTQELFRQMIREFAEKEVKPLAAEIDEQERFPAETVNNCWLLQMSRKRWKSRAGCLSATSPGQCRSAKSACWN